MEIIKTKEIHGKIAQFILEGDRKASVVYDGVTLLNDISWDTIKEDSWMHDALMEAEVANYLEKIN